jgi:integrase
VYWHLHSICDTAVGDGLLAPNPCQLNVKKPARQIEPVTLEPAQVAAAVKVIEPQRFQAMVLIGEWCGLRWGELGELRRKDISDNAEIITVARGHRHEGGCHIDTPKSGKTRTVAVPPHIRADIKHHLDTNVADAPEALLLTGQSKCGHLSDATFRDAWHKALKAVGCQPTRLQDMRHFCGTMTAMTGATLTENMSRMDHSTVTSSVIYQDVVAGADEKIATALSALASADAAPTASVNRLALQRSVRRRGPHPPRRRTPDDHGGIRHACTPMDIARVSSAVQSDY